MPIARLSGVIQGEDDPNRKRRAKLLYRLFCAGWDIYNGNGDQVITLSNIQKKIVESDAFVFTPGATLQDIFHAASIFVGFQTNDADLKGKSAVVMNPRGSWNGFLSLITHMHMMGTVGQSFDDYMKLADRSREVLTILQEEYAAKQSHTHTPTYDPEQYHAHASSLKPKFSVCVFCSASIKKEEYLQEGYDLGKTLAEKSWGCISGAGKTGIMGRVVAGCSEHGGWAGGSNVPHIIEMEGLPDGLAEFWPRPDIYTRMEVMIQESDAFIILPGGMGTVQEVLALVLLKQLDHELMRDKPVIIVNRPENGAGFWDPLLVMLQEHNAENMFDVVRNSNEAIEKLA